MSRHPTFTPPGAAPNDFNDDYESDVWSRFAAALLGRDRTQNAETIAKDADQMLQQWRTRRRALAEKRRAEDEERERRWREEGDALP